MASLALAGLRRRHLDAADLVGLADHELVRRHQGGDPHAAPELLSRWRRGLVGYFVNQVLDEPTAEDLAHDVLVDVLPALDTVDPYRPVWPWLISVARHRLTDHYRHTGRPSGTRRHARAHATVRPSELQDLDHLVEVVDAVSDRPTVRQAIGQLTPRQRFAILRHHVDGWTPEQIAAVLGTNRNAVNQILKRARRSARREYLSLTGGRAPWAVVPWPLVWVRDRVRRVLQRIRGTAQEWQPTLPAAGESMAVSASLAVTATVVASVTWAGGGGTPPAAASPPPPADQAQSAPAFDDLIRTMLADADEDGSTVTDDRELEKLRGTADGSETHGPDTGDSGSDDREAEEPADASTRAAPIPNAGVDTPQVDEPATPTTETRAETGDSADGGKAVDAEVFVVDDEGGKTGPDLDADKDCNTVSGPAACDAADASEGDTSFERTTDGVDDTDVTANESTTEDASQSASDAEDDADDWEVLTDDNCSSDDTLGTACDTADDTTV